MKAVNNTEALNTRTSTSASPSVPTMSYSQFLNHISKHRMRVVALGLEYYRRNTKCNELLSPSLVKEFLRLHDLAKLDNDISVRLYSLFGKNQSPHMKDTVVELNRRDLEIRMTFFKEKNLVDAQGRLSAEATLLIEIERVADLTDRGMDPGAAQEFGRPMQKASIFLATPGLLAAELVEFVIELEADYRDIVGIWAHKTFTIRLDLKKLDDVNLPDTSGFADQRRIA